jgi:hypothetical protein
MRQVSKPRPGFPKPTEDEIRDYAYHLYLQSGCIPGRDLANWQEAESCLRANTAWEPSPGRNQPHGRD